MEWIIFGAGVSGKSLSQYFFKNGIKAFVYNDHPLSSQQKDFFKKFSTNSISANSLKKKLKKGKIAIVTSPSFSLQHPLLKEAKKQKIKIQGEVAFSLEKIKTPIIAITGTNGKSTVASMCFHLLKNSGYKTKLLGNIGTALSTHLIKNEPLDFIVLEISSYQLDTLPKNNFLRSVFLNFSEDHLERHKTLKNYFHAKWKIFKSQNSQAQGFCGPSLKPLALKYGIKQAEALTQRTTPSPYYKKHVPENLRFPKHDEANAAISLQVCRSVCQESVAALAKTLKNFQTIPHRFEQIGKLKEVTFIEDSKATNLDATLSALKSLKEKRVLLFLGGRSKGLDFSPLLKHQPQIIHLISFGEASKTIRASLSDRIKTTSFRSLKEALSSFSSYFSEKDRVDYVLFSPACSSFDEFKNFEERGRFFQKKMRSFLEEQGAKLNGNNRKV